MAIARREQTPLTRRLRRDLDPFSTMRALLDWDPFRPLSPRTVTQAERLTFAPAFDVREADDSYEFTADLPGVKEEDIDVSITGSRLTISGHREEEEIRESETHFCSERSYGSFTRSFTLPEGVRSDDISAELRDGVLHVHVPKPAESKATRIPLKGSSSSEGTKEIETHASERGSEQAGESEVHS